MGGETSKKLRENVDRLAENDSRCVEVNCEGLKIGDRGMTALSDALRTNTRLKSLRLGGCDITHVGAQALADAICQSQDRSSVRKLDFVSCHAHNVPLVTFSACLTFVMFRRLLMFQDKEILWETWVQCL